ncbi:MAG TPA: MMPL family transporter [Candidatus Dormibacteraeota bacterium]
MVALAVSVVSGIFVLPSHLKEDARLDLFVDPTSSLYNDQVRFANAFGADPVVVVFSAPKGHELLTPQHMVGFVHFEGTLHKQAGVQQVYGTGSLVFVLAEDVTKAALDLCGREGNAAEQQAVAKAKQQGKSPSDQIKAGDDAFKAAVQTCAQQLIKQFPDIGLPRPDNPVFYGQILLEPGGNQPRPFWSWTLPDRNHMMVTIRLRPDASQEQVRALLQSIKTAGRDPDLKGLSINVSGTPALAESLAEDVVGWPLTPAPGLLVLGALTIVAMLLVTLLVLRGVRRRWLAVPLAVIAAFWCAGLAGLVGLRLTPASLAVLPVVLGLTTDYGLQTANRLAEVSGTDARARVVTAARSILPSTLLAAVATAAGVLAFAVSPLPLVRQFAFFMALGVGAAWLANLLVGIPLLAVLARRGARGAAAAPEPPAPAWNWVAALGRLRLAVVVPLVVIGLVGWAGLPFVQIETDLQHLMPAGDPAVKQALTVQHETGLAGELDLVVSGPNVSNPDVIAWQQQAGVQAEKNAGGNLRLIDSLPTFLRSFSGNGQLPNAQLTTAILRDLPAYLSQAVITSNHQLSRIVFGQKQITSVQDDSELLRRIQQVSPPPPGYTVFPAGLAVVASTALDALKREQVVLNVLAIALVLVVLLVAYRSLRRSVLAILPATVAAGWATGLLWLSHVQANPVTVLLAGVVVAFATEFSVLWLARFSEELRAGGESAVAADCAAIASRRVGPAVIASAAALVLGFLLLAVSPVPIVREFGLWSGTDLAFATLAVLVLLPPLAVRFARS